MKVIFQPQPSKTITYGEIPTGATFTHKNWDDVVLIKTSKTDNAGVISVKLQTGATFSMPDDTPGFVLVDAEVHVNG